MRPQTYSPDGPIGYASVCMSIRLSSENFRKWANQVSCTGLTTDLRMIAGAGISSSRRKTPGLGRA